MPGKRLSTTNQKLLSGKVGIVAGWGEFPIELARQLQSQGREVYVAAIKGHADPRIEQYATQVQWIGVLKLGAQMRYFTRRGVTHIALAGKLFKDRILYHGRGWIDHAPDLTCIRLFFSSFITRTRNACDDTLLSTVVQAYKRKEIDVLPITDIAPALLVSAGCLTRCRPSRAQLLDIKFGWNIAVHMGGLDIGQSITIKDQMVLGVEAIEGTDALIKRTGDLCPRGGFTLVKVAKPQQDMRFDVPTIGLRTLQNLVRAGGKSIAIEAGRTILLEREATLNYAAKHKVAIVAMESARANSSEPNSAPPDSQEVGAALASPAIEAA